MRATWIIAWSVLLEAVRRKEIYAIVLVSTLLIGAVMTVDFFKLEGLTKFYREIALQVMSTATALATIALAARQLPREFENRTIYPLLAKPISRLTFLLGKLGGVMLAAAFSFALFMAIYVAGTIYTRGTIPVVIFFQYMYLQMVQMLVLACLSFLLSMVMNLDAAITIGVIVYLASSILTSAMTFLYPFADPFGQWVLWFLNYTVPQLSLLDLTDKAVHAGDWSPLEFPWLMAVSAYGFFFAVVYFGAAAAIFRRRAL